MLTPFLHHHVKLKCPYEGCGQSFERPTLMIDASTLPRRTFYTCPHCMSKLDVEVEGQHIVRLKRLDYGKVLESPAKCTRYSGATNALSDEAAVREECLLCPKILQCAIHRR